MFVPSSEKSYLFMDNVKNDNEIYDKDYDEFAEITFDSIIS